MFPVTFAAAALAGFFVACSGGGSNQPNPHPGSATIQAAKGGTVTLQGGPTVEIPAGALAADTVITVQQSSATAPDGAVTAVYEFGPPGTTFSKPVTVTIPVPAGTTVGAIWTKEDGATAYTSLPTTISGGTATAEASHFSIYVVGPVDLTGTWTGAVSYTITNANGTSGTPGTTMQARDVVQNVNDVTYAYTNGSGTSATCSGKLNGGPVTCTIFNFDKTCSATYVPDGSVSGTTWNIFASYTWTGGSCASVGATVTIPGSTLQKQSGAPLNIAGTYSYSGSWTNTGPGLQPISGTNTGTRVRSQAAGSSAVSSTLTITNGATYNCLGPIIGNTVYGHCNGVNGTTTYSIDGVGTVNIGPPLTISINTQGSIYNDPGHYTTSTGTASETLE
jgi:hypothetical protein